MFPSMKSAKLLRILMRKPLHYVIVRIRGSHRMMESPNYPKIWYSFHESRELTGIEVRRVLTKQVGLTLNMALEVIR